MDFVSRESNDWYSKVFLSTSKALLIILYYYGVYIYIAPNLSYSILSMFLSQETASYYAQFLSDSICMFPIVYLMLPLLKDCWRHFEEYPSMILYKGISLYIPYMFTNSILQTILFTFTGTNSGVNQEIANKLFEAAPIALAIPAILIAPIVEECIFRGVIFRGMRVFGFWPAAIVSGFAFGFLHCISDIVTANWSGLWFIIVYTSMGVFMCKAYENSKNIFGAISLHMFSNIIAIIAMSTLM